MNRLKKFLRLAGIICLMLLASLGIGVPVSMNSREKYLEYEIKIEQVDTREDESESELKERK